MIFFYLNNKITMDVINKQEETREKFDHLAYKRRYYHEHEEFRKDKNRKNRERSALRYRNNPEFRKTIIDRAVQFYHNKKLKGSGNILSFIELK